MTNESKTVKNGAELSNELVEVYLHTNSQRRMQEKYWSYSTKEKIAVLNFTSTKTEAELVSHIINFSIYLAK